MAFPASGNFDYWLGGRPRVTLAKTTGDFDYWLGGRPLPIAATTPAAAAYSYARPIADIAANGWTASTGSDLYAMLDEATADNDDYISSPSNPTTQQFEVQLSAIPDPGSTADHHLDYRLQALNFDTTFDFDLVEGTTVLDSWSEAVTVADGVVERSRDFSGTVIGTITDRSDVRVRGVDRAP